MDKKILIVKEPFRVITKIMRNTVIGSKESVVSIHDLPPLNKGGIVARNGFMYQDHVAAHYCIQMLSDTAITQVWCESLDDITVIRKNDNDVSVEFIQVKSGNTSRLWSVAQLCETKNGESIFEKSFKNDRIFKETRTFTIVSSSPVDVNLKILTSPLNSRERKFCQKSFRKLMTMIYAKMNIYSSPKGNKCYYWVCNTLWVVMGTENNIINNNIINVIRYIESQGNHIAYDQAEEVYKRVIRNIQEISRSDCSMNPDANKLHKDNLRTLILNIVNEIIYPAKDGKGINLQNKLQKAKIPLDTIMTAKVLRMRYKEQRLSPKYFDSEKLDEIESEVIAELNKMKSSLDAGDTQDSGVQFHARCLNKMELIKNTFSSPSLSSSLLQGLMYDIADRCLLRFTRAEP